MIRSFLKMNLKLFFLVVKCYWDRVEILTVRKRGALRFPIERGRREEGPQSGARESTRHYSTFCDIQNAKEILQDK